MSCTKHVLAFQWERHAWQRRVTLTENWTADGTDMWGRTVPIDQVFCHTEHVCRHCGEVRDDGDCGCDAEVGATCAVRLAALAERRALEHAPTA